MRYLDFNYFIAFAFLTIVAIVIMFIAVVIFEIIKFICRRIKAYSDNKAADKLRREKIKQYFKKEMERLEKNK